MMVMPFNAPGVAPPSSNYSHAVSVGPNMRWLVISGQVGLTPHGELRRGFGAQLEQSIANVLQIMAAERMAVRSLVKLTVYAVPSGPCVIAEYRTVRDRLLGDHAAAATFLGISGLAHPDFLVQVEGLAAADP